MPGSLGAGVQDAQTCQLDRECSKVANRDHSIQGSIQQSWEEVFQEGRLIVLSGFEQVSNAPSMGRSISGCVILVPASGEVETVDTAAASCKAATTANQTDREARTDRVLGAAAAGGGRGCGRRPAPRGSGRL